MPEPVTSCHGRRAGPAAAKKCLAGLTPMFHEEATRIWDYKETSPPLEAARRILGLDPPTTREVFEGESTDKKLHELGRDQMLHALEPAAADAVGSEGWK